jgi:hypothetical protein
MEKITYLAEKFRDASGQTAMSHNLTKGHPLTSNALSIHSSAWPERMCLSVTSNTSHSNRAASFIFSRSA